MHGSFSLTNDPQSTNQLLIETSQIIITPENYDVEHFVIVRALDDYYHERRDTVALHVTSTSSDSFYSGSSAVYGWGVFANNPKHAEPWIASQGVIISPVNHSFPLQSAVSGVALTVFVFDNDHAGSSFIVPSRYALPRNWLSFPIHTRLSQRQHPLEHDIPSNFPFLKQFAQRNGQSNAIPSGIPDQLQFSLSTASVRQNGNNNTIAFKISSQPTSFVSVRLSCSHPNLLNLSPKEFNISPNDWNQYHWIVASARDEHILTKPKYVSIKVQLTSVDPFYDGHATLWSGPFRVLIYPPALVKLSHTRLDLYENGAGANYSVILGSEPIHVEPRDPSFVVSPYTLRLNAVRDTVVRQSTPNYSGLTQSHLIVGNNITTGGVTSKSLAALQFRLEYANAIDGRKLSESAGGHRVGLAILRVYRLRFFTCTFALSDYLF